MSTSEGQHKWESWETPEKTREARLRWYGHLRRKDDGYIGRRMLRMELPWKRKRGRPKRRFMDVVKEDMAEAEVTEEDTVDRNNWRRKIRCGDPWWEKPKEEEVDLIFWNGSRKVHAGDIVTMVLHWISARNICLSFAALGHVCLSVLPIGKASSKCH